MNKKRALVLGSGGLGRGAYGAAALATFCRAVGPHYFQGMYGSSAGAQAIPFGVANQPDTIEHTWLELCPGTKLINPFNTLRGRKVLDLAYLREIYRDHRSWLDIEAVFNSGIEIVFALTDYETGQPTYFRPDRSNIFDAMSASSAMPFVHGPVALGGRRYIDGSLTDPLPIEKALEDGYKEVVAVWYHPVESFRRRGHKLYWNTVHSFLPSQFKNSANLYIEKDAMLKSHPQVLVIRPSENLPIKWILDTNAERLKKTWQLGVKDTLKFLEGRT